MGIPVKLQVFEGPLDLLLHLIDKNKIDIYDIPIVEITDQYLEYIQQMQREDLNIMSEFMVMAATLLDIKCRMLLPKEVDEEGQEEDPREELVQQLLEYKMYKYMSYELRDRMGEASMMAYKSPTLPPEVLAYREPVDTEELLGDLTLEKMHTIFKSILRRQEDKVDPIRSQFGEIQQAERPRANKGGEDAELRRRAQKEAAGIGNQGAEVRHGADPQENQGRIDAEFHALVQVPHQAALVKVLPGSGGNGHDAVDFLLCVDHDLIHLIVYALIEMLELLRRERNQGILLRIHDTRQGQVHQQHAEGDRQQQQRFELLFDRQINQHAGDADHDQVFPAAVLKVEQAGKPGFLP